MKIFSPTLDAQALKALPMVRYEGDPQLVLDSASTPLEATENSVIFLENKKECVNIVFSSPFRSLLTGACICRHLFKK